MRKIFVIMALFVLFAGFNACLAGGIDIARLKYGGGGDWYNDPDEETNLLKEYFARTGQEVDPEKFNISANDDQLFSHPFLFITGHGGIKFTEREVKRLRRYIESGGFIYADDDFGMDTTFRREMKRILPECSLQELPFTHPIYNCYYDFSGGLPKIHEHEKGRPVGYGIYFQERLVLFYSFNTNISDGWTNAHNDPPEVREQAIRMGINILWYAVTNP
jgi:hypothetical protein